MKVSLDQGSLPLLFSFVDCGIQVPDEIGTHMTESAKALVNRPRRLLQMFGFARRLGASTIVANFSRLVIDADREPPSVSGLFQEPDRDLCPINCDTGIAVYRPGFEPDEFEVGRRVSEYWRYLHDDLQEELLRIRHVYGIAVLIDVHGNPDSDAAATGVSIGTGQGQTCAPEIALKLEQAMSRETSLQCQIDPNNDGFIVRHYGKPESGTHAIRLQFTGSSSGRPVDQMQTKTAIAGTTAALESAMTSMLEFIQSARRSS